MTEPARTVVPCHGCGAVDDHPRHVIINSFTDDSQNLVKHLDCCAAEGCTDCGARLAAADGKRGLDLAAHLQAQPATVEES